MKSLKMAIITSITALSALICSSVQAKFALRNDSSNLIIFNFAVNRNAPSIKRVSPHQTIDIPVYASDSIILEVDNGSNVLTRCTIKPSDKTKHLVWQDRKPHLRPQNKILGNNVQKSDLIIELIPIKGR